MIDPRGPLRTATAVELTNTITLVTLDCGHVANFVTHFRYRVGNKYHCFQCREEERQ